MPPTPAPRRLTLLTSNSSMKNEPRIRTHPNPLAQSKSTWRRLPSLDSKSCRYICSLDSYFPVLHHFTLLPQHWSSLSDMLHFLSQQYQSWNWSWRKKAKSDNWPLLVPWSRQPPQSVPCRTEQRTGNRDEHQRPAPPLHWLLGSSKAALKINALLIHPSLTLISALIDCKEGCTRQIIFTAFVSYMLHSYCWR